MKAESSAERRGATAWALARAESIPGLRSPRVADRLRSSRDAALRVRRRLFEAAGRDTYSRPALGDLDVRLQQFLPPRGFFVEAGANDGYNQSNTYYLERFRGWTGLLIEPVPDLYRRAKRERPNSSVVNCALVGPELSGQQIAIHHAGLLSIVDGARGDALADRTYLEHAAAVPFASSQYSLQVPGRTLSELLTDLGSPHVDFLSLDLEGYEDRALAGLDLTRHLPDKILVEALDAGAEQRLRAQLATTYELLARMPPNDLLFSRIG